MDRANSRAPIKVAIPSPARHGLPMTIVGRDRGLPSAQVHSISQDSSGRIWFAGPSGLSCHHGTSISVHAQDDGLSTHGLRIVVALGNGGLLIGTDLGVDEMRPDGSFEQVLGPSQWRHGVITQIVVEPDGTAWLATSDALLEWRRSGDGAMIVHDEPALDGGFTIALDRSGALWVSTGRQLRVRRPGQWTEVAGADDLVGTVRCITATTTGMLLAGDRGVVEVTTGGQQHVIATWQDPMVATALAYSPREIWLGHAGTLTCHASRGPTWSPRYEIDVGSRINDVFIDSVRNVWVATDNLGVIKVSALREALRPAAPSGPGAAFTISQTRGTVLIGGDGGAVSVAAHRATPIDALAHEKVWDLVADKRGRLWAATQGGLFSGPVDAMRLEDHPQLRLPGRVLLERRDGMYLGTVGGLFRVTHDDVARSITPMLGPDERPLGYVYCLAEDSTGVLWLGTIGRGLWREAPGGGLRPVECAGLTSTGNTYAIAIAADHGLAVVQDNRIVEIAPDGTGRIVAEATDPVAGWAACFRGDQLAIGSSHGLRIYRWPSGELIRTIAGGRVDGWEFTTSRSLSRDDRGQLWCGTNNGCSIVDLDWFEDITAGPTLHTREAQWSNVTPVAGTEGIEVCEGKWSVAVPIGAPWFLDETDLRVRHRLLGFERDWSAYEVPADIVYSSLPVGQYTLQAQAYSPLVGAGPVHDLMQLRVVRARTEALVDDDATRGLVSPLEVEQLVRLRTLELAGENRRLRTENEALNQTTLVDALTQVGNRRAFDAALAREMSRTRRHGQPFALVLVDIDHFKRYNDTFGHVDGDRCLAAVARALKAAVRPEDAVCRYGGEEFAVLFPDSGRDDVATVCTRLRTRIAELGLEHPSSTAASHVTISLGAVVFGGEPGFAAVDLVTSADRALYRAKHEGRDRFVVGKLAGV